MSDIWPTVGHFFEHPEDGPIYITGGQKFIDGRLSNLFGWRVIQTGEHKTGYAGAWPCIDDQWYLNFVNRVTGEAWGRL